MYLLYGGSAAEVGEQWMYFESREACYVQRYNAQCVCNPGRGS